MVSALLSRLNISVTLASAASLFLLLAFAPAGKAGQPRTGGLVVPGIARVSDVVCVKRCVSARKATPGATVRISGRYLDTVRRVVFPGRRSPIRVATRSRSFGAIRAIVPKLADDGRPFVITGTGRRSNRAPRELAILPASRIPVEVFPVRGRHDFGSSGARFGAGRTGYSHQGQDVMARCGTPLVSIRRARVLFNQYHSAAGNYVVLRNLGTNTQFAYMHLIRRSPLRVGQIVGAGQRIGLVGQTGRAYGCHLHFEYWIGAWQQGGRPINPLPYLRSLR
jgi:murein DD-endopeptidase MepM/ murein hydrolase activator NlpD